MSETAATNMMDGQNAQSKLQYYVFPTVFKNCYQVEVITNGSQLYPTDTDSSTPAIYQLLDNIMLDKYADFNGGVQAACAPSVCDDEHHSIEPWEDVSTIFIRKITDPIAVMMNGDGQVEGENELHTSKDILVSWLRHLLDSKQFGYRLGCVNNRSFDFRRSDGSVHVGIFSQCDEDQQMISVLENGYDESVKQFIDLVLQIIANDSENAEYSLYVAANLCAYSTQAERDEFFAIVTPYNQTIIMLGLFFNRYYY